MQDEIERIRIPDEDMPGWIQTLRETGFSDKEIDSILRNLNSTYAGLKKEEFVVRELKKMEEEVSKRRGSGFTEQERIEMKKGIESRFSSNKK